ncbi:MAG TPA: protease inhibitor I42 family protein [Opitutaceae bacterium]|nr:protease inhibitor I42 family protein [Opitutaceae bacterium]
MKTRLSRFSLSLAVLLVGLSLLTGCQTEASKVLNLTIADHGRAVSVKKGEPIQIVLEGNPTTGLTWLVDDLDVKVVALAGTPSYAPSSDALGAGGKFTFNFTALARGQTNMRIIYIKPSERGRDPDKTFAIMITVR